MSSSTADASQMLKTLSSEHSDHTSPEPKRRKIEMDQGSLETLLERVAHIGKKLGCKYIYLLEDLPPSDEKMEDNSAITDVTDEFKLMNYCLYDSPCESIRVYRYKMSKDQTVDYSDLKFIETNCTTTMEYQWYLVLFEVDHKPYVISSVAISKFASVMNLKVVTAPSILGCIHGMLLNYYTNLKRLKVHHPQHATTQSTDKSYQKQKSPIAAINKAISQMSTVSTVKVGKDRGQWVEYHPSTGSFHHTTHGHFKELLTLIILFHRQFVGEIDDRLLIHYDYTFCNAIQLGAYNLRGYSMDDVTFGFEDQELEYTDFQKQIICLDLTVDKLHQVTISHLNSGNKVPFLTVVNCVFYCSFDHKFLKVVNETYVQQIEIVEDDGVSEYVTKLKGTANQDEFLKTLVLPKWTKHPQFYEAFYNILLFQHLKENDKCGGCFFGDRICFRNVEICDVACEVNGVLYLFHVKRKKDAEMAHLVSQVLAALTVWKAAKTDEDYFQTVVEKVEELVKNKAKQAEKTPAKTEVKKTKKKRIGKKSPSKKKQKSNASPTTEQKKLAEECSNLVRTKYETGEFEQLFSLSRVVLVMVVPNLDNILSLHARIALQQLEEQMDAVGVDAQVAVMEFQTEEMKSYSQSLQQIYRFSGYQKPLPSKGGFEIIDDTLRSQNMRTQQVPADGNCMYHAILSNSFMAEKGLTIQSLRNEVADFVLSIPDWESMMKNYGLKETREEYAEKIRRDKEYGDHTVLELISSLFSVEIHVYQPTASAPIKIGTKESKTIVCIAYNRKFEENAGHYRAVVPL